MRILLGFTAIFPILFMLCCGSGNSGGETSGGEKEDPVTDEVSKVPCTGQKLCYTREYEHSKNPEDFEIDCQSDTALGEDGQYFGKELCIPLYFSSTHGTMVYDSASDLLWLNDINKAPYEDAKSYCENRVYGDYDDWRLPEIHELVNLVDTNNYSYSKVWPVFGDKPFYKLLSANVSGNKSLRVDFYDGSVELRESKYESDFICVRGNQTETSTGFQIAERSGDEIVKDRRTGLIWQKSKTFTKDMDDALSYCENLDYAGYSDWRLPNRNELFSLVHYAEKAPMSSFPDISLSCFWTSTTTISKTDEVLRRKTRAYEDEDEDYDEEDPYEEEDPWSELGNYYENEALCVNFETGTIESEDKGNWHDVKCVRSKGSFENKNGEKEEENIITYDNGSQWTEHISGNYDHFKDAVNFCKNLKYGGFKDWRLPSLYDYFAVLDFSKGPTGDYMDFWTSTKYAGELHDGYEPVWIVNEERIEVKPYSTDFTGLGAIPYHEFYVRCIRGAETGAAESVFNSKTINRDEVVEDSASGLMWQKNPQFVELKYDEVTGEEGSSFCENLDYAGFNDWHFATVDELLTLFDFTKTEPASSFPGIIEAYRSDKEKEDKYLHSSTGLAFNPASGEMRRQSLIRGYFLCVR